MNKLKATLFEILIHQIIINTFINIFVYWHVFKSIEICIILFIFIKKMEDWTIDFHNFYIES